MPARSQNPAKSSLTRPRPFRDENRYGRLAVIPPRGEASPNGIGPVRLLSVKRSARRMWPAVVIVVIAAGMVGLAVFVWRSPHRNDLEAFASFAVGIAGLAAGPIIYLARIGRPENLGRGRSVDDVADLLAVAVKDQWTRAAVERRLQPEPIPVQWARPSQAFTGPVASAVGSRQFSPLPGLTAIRQAQLRKGGLGDLHALYGRLGSGRMVIVGAPGSGKTGAAIVLVLDALRHRAQVPEKDRPLVPVPVMFTLQGWDPNTQLAQDWLAACLQETYPLFAGKVGMAQVSGIR